MGEEPCLAMSGRVALICGVLGQDGSLLAAHLVKVGYNVFGSTRNIIKPDLSNLERLGISDSVNLLLMIPEDFKTVMAAVGKARPDEIYYLSGQSSVGLSYDLPMDTITSVTVGLLNILEYCRLENSSVKIFHAGSSECFGDTGGERAHERTEFNPISPYGVAKCSAYWLARNYREAFGLNVCSGILFNHESSLRPSHFVMQKIVRTVREISRGSEKRLVLGRLDISRDWGWAPEYVEAMHLMLQQERISDYVIASGESYTLEEVLEIAFGLFDLEWRKYVDVNSEFFRPSEILVSRANPIKVHTELRWRAKVNLPDMIEKLLNNELS